MKRLISEAEIQAEVARLGATLSEVYRDRPLTVLCVLTGSIIFLSDLIRTMQIPLRVGLIQASSYRGRTTTAGQLTIDPALLANDIAGRDVLLVDDIFDTGRTLDALLGVIRSRGAANVSSAVLLWKEGRSEVGIEPDYYGFKIPDVFVVGYGLDYNDDYRHLPYIAALEDGDL